MATRLLTVPLAVLAIMAAGCGALTGPSESYSWGQRVGNTAVSLVKAGVDPSTSTATGIYTPTTWTPWRPLSTPPLKLLRTGCGLGPSISR